jgi:16S rRNA (cytosine967-C5)-methyltransferase
LPKTKQVPGLALRLTAADRLQQVLKGASFSPLAASEVADGRDRALGNRLVTTALRYHGPIGKLIGELLQRGIPKKSGRFEAMLRLSLAQLLFLPDLGDHSALFLAGEAMRADQKTQHLIKLMNGVLREAQRRRESVVASAEALFPDHLLAQWRDAHGVVAVEAFGRALIEGAPLDLTIKTPIEGLDA